jgi:hypothetical protein
MRPSLLLLSLATGLCAGGHELATDYGKARTLATTSELELDLSTTLFEMKVDDKPADNERGPGGSSSSLVRKCVLVDQELSGAAGEPRHLKRTFETLHDQSTFSFGEDERSDERDFPLQGLTLELERKQDGTVSAELTDGTKPDDEALLEGHELALALDAFLPEGAVELDAKWELDDATLKRALATALDAKLFADPPPEEGRRGEGGGGPGGGGGRGGGRSRGGAARSLSHVEWSGKAKLAALDEEHDGLKCAKIELELEGDGELPEPSFRGPPRNFAFAPVESAPALAGKVHAKLAGALYVSLEQRRPVALSLDGELSTENTSERERDEHKFSTHSIQSGRLTLTIKIEER